MAETRRYSDSEVRDIIERALSASGGGPSGTSHEDLLAIGEQIGISAEAMTRAAREAELAEVEAKARAAVTGRRRKWLWGHAAVFALINGLLFAVNALTTPGEWWVLFPLFFWTLALALHAAGVLALGVSERALSAERARLGSARPERLRVAEPARSELVPEARDTTEEVSQSRAAR